MDIGKSQDRCYYERSRLAELDRTGTDGVGGKNGGPHHTGGYGLVQNEQFLSSGGDRKDS